LWNNGSIWLTFFINTTLERNRNSSAYSLFWDQWEQCHLGKTRFWCIHSDSISGTKLVRSVHDFSLIRNLFAAWQANNVLHCCQKCSSNVVSLWKFHFSHRTLPIVFTEKYLFDIYSSPEATEGWPSSFYPNCLRVTYRMDYWLREVC
jgi:hypothetical protein